MFLFCLALDMFEIEDSFVFYILCSKSTLFEEL